jgi:hypothetical protein
MKSKKNSIKEKNILNIRGTSYGIIVIRACIFNITLFAFTNIALALNWKDKEVTEAGCPETSIGEWKSEILNFHNEKIINIQDNKIVIIDYQNSDKYFLSNKDSLKIGDKFVELPIKTDDQKEKVYLKVRPHLITTRIDYENSNHSTHNC